MKSGYKAAAVRTLQLSSMIAVTGSLSSFVCAAETVQEFVVYGVETHAPSFSGDAAELLKKEGVQFYSAGGISKLPVMRGMNDDRIKVLIDGAETTSACANHMNPALSYIDASRIKVAQVLAGITSVSLGGDSIAGTVVIQSAKPLYAEATETLLSTGSLSGLYKSNRRNYSEAGNFTLASDWLSLEYSGSNDKSESYEDGNGDKVLDTLYRAESHTMTLGARNKDQELVLKVNHQEVPYQGFPNQYMDMVGNVSNGVNFNYLRTYSWGELDGRVTWQDVSHQMGFFSKEKTGMMPMITEGRDLGYTLKVTAPNTEDSTLAFGGEYHKFTLDDWWPAVDGSMMMGPNDFVNIEDGEKSRIALWAETQYQINPRWLSVFGLRYEHVETNAGNAQAYNSKSSMMMPNLDADAATAFNNRPHKQTDDNIDLTLQMRYQPNPYNDFEFGYGRKTRTPNLYERYSWGRNTMAMTMIGWFGDTNGYVGNLNLNPEIAHTVSASYSLRAANHSWLLSAAPYYTYVDDYIDVEQVGGFNPRMVMTITRPKLQFINADAEFFGFDIKGQLSLWESMNWGKGSVNGLASYTRGKRRYSNDDLYQIMPLNISLQLAQSIRRWTNTIEIEWADNKDKVDTVRLENTTKSYALLNASTRVNWQQYTLSLSATNLLNEYYELPLGGINYAKWRAGGMSGPLEPMSGQGRSIDLGLTFEF